MFFAFLFSIMLAHAEKPVSASYQSVVKCYPQLTNDKLQQKVDLDILKDGIDKSLTTLHSTLRYREVVYKESGELRALRYALKKNSKADYELTLSKVDDKGSYSPLSTPDAQRNKKPKQKDIGDILSNSEVQSDVIVYEDVKLNDLVLVFKKNLGQIVDLTLTDQVRKRELSCENQKDLGIICTCSLK